MVQKIIIRALGIWLILSTIFLRTSNAYVLNFLAVGIIAAISGLTLTVKKTIEGWTGAVLGIWLIISAFIPVFEATPCKYCNAIIIGAIFIVIGFAKIKEEESVTLFADDSKTHTYRY